MDTYITTGTLKRDGEYLEPGTEIELSDEEAAPLLANGAIREPGSEVAAPSSAAQANPLSPQTVAEVETMVGVIDDVDRLNDALDYEASHDDRKGAIAAIQARQEELAEEDGG